MKLIINGKKKTFKPSLNLYEFLEKEGYNEMMIAVAYNGVFTPKSSYIEISLKDDDEIEIVAPMQGG
ncbi:MAG: sulfur carrier protein ThiS [Alphaproteobacteria bacterium]|nr:sulfur carrier protein ThiS [Alphaproteobacteria bacterium]